MRVMKSVGVRTFKPTSGLGHPYVCHLGDIASENPFYNLEEDVAGLRLMAAWCADETRPVIFDVGANVGFVCTQLAQMLKDAEPMVIAFEPVWSTFAKLKFSIKELGLEDRITPICCAISDGHKFVPIAFDEGQSLFAQIRPDTANARVGGNQTWASTQTLDTAVETLALHPTLLKVDVEGFEAYVLRGAKNLLSSFNPPAIFFEWNPLTLREIGIKPEEIIALLRDWNLYYVDDFEGQRKPLGELVSNAAGIDWTCNFFAVPPTEQAASRWAATCKKLQIASPR